MYSIIYDPSALKELKKLDKESKQRIIATIERCRIRPHIHVKKIIGSPYFRLRAGKYRIILDIKENRLIIFVIEVNKRERIYKKI